MHKSALFLLLALSVFFCNCNCNCDSGWTGAACNVPLTVPVGNGVYLSAEVAPSFSGKFTYHTTTVDFKLLDGSGDADTVIIDGYHNEDDWVYFEIYTDLTALNAPVAIPLDGTRVKGTVFGSYKDKNTGEIYHTDAGKAGDSIYLDVYSANPLKITGRFTHHLSYPFISQSVTLNNGQFSSY